MKSFDVPMTQEEFDTLRDRPNATDDSPEMIEVVVRATRRLAHEIDPHLAIAPAEPFDVSREVEAIRGVVLTEKPAMALGDNSLLAFLKREVDGWGPFDAAIWRETWAIAGSKPWVTDDAGAQAYALATVILHVMTPEQILAATRRGWADLETEGVSVEDIDLDLSTPRDRRLHAMTDPLGASFFVHEYYGEDVVG